MWYSEYVGGLRKLQGCRNVNHRGKNSGEFHSRSTNRSTNPTQTRTAERTHLTHSTTRFLFGQTYRNSLEKCKGFCESTVIHLEGALNLVSNISEHQAEASITATEFSRKCTVVLDESKRLEEIGQRVRGPMGFFDDLNRLGVLLGLPLRNPDEDVLLVDNDELLEVDLNVVAVDPGGQPFKDTLCRLHTCIEYLEARAQYYDATLYLASFRKLKRRALALMKNQIIATLGKLEVEENVWGGESNQPAGLTRKHIEILPIYSRWKLAGKEIGPSVKDLRDACAFSPNLNDFQSITECESVYFKIREPALLQLLNQHLTNLGKHPANAFNDILRNGVLYILRILNLEVAMYTMFFNFHLKQGSLSADSELGTNEAFTSMTRSVVNSLYVFSRPTILAQNEIDTLCDLVHLLQTEILEDLLGDRKVKFRFMESMVRQLLEDAQERLVYRVHTFVVEEIELYEPVANDLDYPKQLEIRLRVDEPRTAHARWYPTLDRTLICLSKLYRCVDSQVFESVAHDALHVCTRSLVSASECIGLTQSSIDGTLFLIKHFLILREQINPFEIHFSLTDRHLDFSTTANAFLLFLQRVGAWFSLSGNNALFTLLHDGIPEVVSSEVDVKKDLELQLKQACEAFIFLATETGAGPLLVVLREQKHNITSEVVPTVPFFTMKDAWKEMSNSNLEKFSSLLAKLHLYLGNSSTEKILIKPAVANIQTCLKRAKTISLSGNCKIDDFARFIDPCIARVDAYFMQIDSSD